MEVLLSLKGEEYTLEQQIQQVMRILLNLNQLLFFPGKQF